MGEDLGELAHHVFQDGRRGIVEEGLQSWEVDTATQDAFQSFLGLGTRDMTVVGQQRKNTPTHMPQVCTQYGYSPHTQHKHTDTHAHTGYLPHNTTHIHAQTYNTHTQHTHTQHIHTHISSPFTAHTLVLRSSELLVSRNS